MELNFEYVSLYGMFRFVTKVGMSFICGVLVMIYASFVLD
jgi:hypothetical protein